MILSDFFNLTMKQQQQQQITTHISRVDSTHNVYCSIFVFQIGFKYSDSLSHVCYLEQSEWVRSLA